MDLESTLGAAASTGGVALGLAPLLQARVVIARRSAEGVSRGYWIVLTLAMGLWLAYGLASSDLPIIVANTVSVSTGLFMLALTWVWRTRAPQNPPEPRNRPPVS